MESSRSTPPRPDSRRLVGGAPELGALLRAPHFRVLVGSRWLSQCSDGLLQAALAGYLLFNPDKATSAGQLAALLGVTLIPYSVLGPFVGVFIDRWRRQPIVQWVPAGRALLSVAVAALIAGGDTGPALYATVLLSLSANRFYLATQGASVPHVAGTGSLLTANAVASTGGTIVAFVGGAFGALLGRGGGAVTVELCSAALYVLSALLSLRLPRELLGPDQPVTDPLGAALGGVWRELVEGAVATVRTRPAVCALGVVAADRFLVSLMFVDVLLVYRHVLHTGLSGLAQTLVGAGVGTVVAAIATPRLGRFVSRRTIVCTSMVACGVGVAVFVPSLRAWTLAAAAVVVGITQTAVKIVADTTVQEAMPDRLRGRVFALYDVLYNVAFVLAAVIAALVVPPSGRSVAGDMIVAGAFVLSAAVYAFASRPAASASGAPA